MTSGPDADVAAIREIVARQFASMSWLAGGEPDWSAFSADFLPGTSLFPSARPVAASSIDQFVARMRGLVGGVLKSFDENVIGVNVVVFGNVATAVIACENVENGVDVNRNVEMMLLVKSDGQWRIAAQAWDRETPENPIGPALLSDS